MSLPAEVRKRIAVVQGNIVTLDVDAIAKALSVMTDALAALS